MTVVVFFWLYQLLQQWRADCRLYLQRLQKLEDLMQAGNRLVSRATGRRYTVEASEMCIAFLRGEDGRLLVVDWMSPSGSMRPSLADNWEQVPSEGAAPAAG